jgi:hypothetical protein
MMAAAGFCVYVILYQWSCYRYLSRFYVVIVVLSILLLPSYYLDARGANARLLLKDYRTLAPFQEIICRPGTILLTAGYTFEICFYLGLGQQNCNAFSYWALRSQVKDDIDWLAILDKHGINLFYADENVLNDPQGPRFISDPKAYGWETIGYQNAAGRKWMLLQKPRH